MQSGSLKRLQITSSNRQGNDAAIDYGAIVKKAANFEDTKQILDKYSTQRPGGAQGSKNRRIQSGVRNKSRVIFSSESNDEKIKLVVVQNTFTDVI